MIMHRVAHVYTYRWIIEIFAFHVIVNTFIWTIVDLWFGGARQNHLFQWVPAYSWTEWTSTSMTSNYYAEWKTF